MLCVVQEACVSAAVILQTRQMHFHYKICCFFVQECCVVGDGVGWLNSVTMRTCVVSVHK